MTLTFSRRTFLQWTGIIGIATTGVPDIARSLARETHYARLLRPAVSPDGTRRLLQDTVVALDHMGARDYRWLRLTDFQPMPGYGASKREAFVPSALPALAEISAPIAPLFRHCNAHSDAIGRMGYGSGAWVVDYLPPASAGSSAWIAIADDAGSRLGWSQATYWADELSSDTSPMTAVRLRIESRSQAMSLVDGGSTIAEWQMSGDEVTEAGTTHVLRRCVRYGPAAAPLTWAIELANGMRIGGADWHNNFGTPSRSHQIEIHPYLAKWLYRHLPDGAPIDFL